MAEQTITIKPQISSRADAQGLHRIEFRITINRQHAYLGSNEKIEYDDWSPKEKKVKKSHPRYRVLNDIIDLKLDSLNTFRRNLKGTNITASEFKEQFLNPNKQEHTLISFFEKVIKRFEANPHSRRTTQSYQVVLNKLIKFIKIKGKVVELNDTNRTFIEDFEAFIRINVKSKSGKNENTVTSNLKIIRSVINKAISEGMLDYKNYPFGKYGKKIKWTKNIKVPLSKTEIDILINAELERDSNIFHTRNIFAFQFFSCGMRIEDALKLEWSNIKETNAGFEYKAGKNGKDMSPRIIPITQNILEYYKNKKQSRYVFPFLKDNYHINKNTKEYKDEIKNLTANINSYLYKLRIKLNIKPKISTHIARHSFANYSLEQNLEKYNDPKIETIMINLGHSSSLITKNYLPDLPSYRLMEKVEDVFVGDTSKISL
jgi:integrase/recombinase XerD